MAYRLYLVPKIGSGIMGDAFRPKYFDGLTWSGMDYGFQPLFLVAADLPGATDTAIVANSDVFGFPFDLNVNLTEGEVNSARDVLEDALVPAQSLSPQDTWKSAARMVASMFAFMQRMNFVFGNQQVFIDASDLDAQFGSLSQELQDAFIATAQSLGYSTSSMIPNAQIRNILKSMADEWGNTTFQLNEFIF
jgi:hypothetical protein